MIINKIYRRAGRESKRLRELPRKKLLNSDWYYSKFPHLRAYQNLAQGLDIIVLGSTPAKFSIDFSDERIKGANLAVCPETITYDFNVLKNYHSYLKEGGMILFVLCPFTFCKDKYRKGEGNQNYLNLRYYPILHRAMIDNFDINLYSKWVKNPFSVGKEAKIGLLKDIVKSVIGRKTHKSKVLSADEMEQSAKKRIDDWMLEFKMKKPLVDEIPQFVKDSIAYNISVFKEMLGFLNERGYKYKVIIPPFSKELTGKIPLEFRNYTLFNPLTEVGADYISYIGDDKWFDNAFFKDAFCLNEQGRKALTRDIVSKLKKENLL